MKTSIKSREDNVAFYEARKEGLKKVARSTVECKTFGNKLPASVRQWLNSEKWAAKDATVNLIVQDWCATHGLSLKDLVETFCAGFYKSVIIGFCYSYSDSKLYKDTSVDGITFQLSGGAASEEGGALTKSKEAVDSVDEKEVIETSICSPSRPKSVNGVYCFRLFPWLSPSFLLVLCCSKMYYSLFVSESLYAVDVWLPVTIRFFHLGRFWDFSKS